MWAVIVFSLPRLSIPGESSLAKRIQQAGALSSWRLLKPCSPSLESGGEPTPEFDQFLYLLIKKLELIRSQRRDTMAGRSAGVSLLQNSCQLLQAEAGLDCTLNKLNSSHGFRAVESVPAIGSHSFPQ